ncbi:Exosome complex component [Lachnellula occidentalis]|uniref:Exosome complex component n=1 Tax=Lachnellula occidentalis TaxID=215460 RepID=A0A8H8S5J7_9HELO|nr:Exosome complex component [Lachnellula occidentalis]
MAISAEPTALLSHLHRTDGSATFSQNGYTVVGAVNGPIEVQRRDELPEEAAIDVNIRPAAGVGGTRERHLESILQSTLRQIILITNFPRTLIQVTLQITSTPENDTAGSKLVQASSNLAILPALLQTAILTLLSASIPLAVTLTSVVLALNNSNGKARTTFKAPTVVQFQAADSVHVLAFTSQGELLVAESEGIFTLEDWDEAYETAKALCCDETAGEVIMQDEGENKGSLMSFVKSTLEEKVAKDLHWKD